MATVKKDSSRLRIQYDGGVIDGKAKVIARTYNQIAVTASDDSLYATANAIAGLQDKPVLAIKRVDESTIQA